MRAIFRWFFLILKAVLFAVALGTAILWIWTWNTPIRIQRIHSQKIERNVDYQVVWFASGSGGARMGVVTASENKSCIFRMFPGVGSDTVGEIRTYVLQHPRWTVDEGNWFMFWVAYGEWEQWRHLGIKTWKYSGSEDIEMNESGWVVGGPLWLIVLLTGTWPFVSLTLWFRGGLRRRSRRLTGCCQSCGYDLRATPDASGPLLEKCPECGAPSIGLTSPPAQSSPSSSSK